MEILFIKLSNGTMMTQHRVDENYDDAENIASELCENFHPGETFKWAIADKAGIDSLLAGDEDRSLDDFDISEKQKVPDGHKMFFREGRTASKVAKKELVLHCAG